MSVPAGVTRRPGLTTFLGHALAADIPRLTSHPWLGAAAGGTLRSAQLGCWAAQDLRWREKYYARAYAAAKAAPGLPEACKEAFAWLDCTIEPEMAWLRELDAGVDEYAANVLWPSFEGYGSWAALTAGDDPLQALTFLWTREASCHWSFSAVQAAGPARDEIRRACRTWASTEFAAMVTKLGAGLDEYAAAAGPATLDRQFTVALTTVRWEIVCWTAAYDLNGWS